MSSSIKFVFGILVLAVIGLGALWIYGGKKLSYSTELVIAAPPASVFRYLRDEELQKKWKTGLLEVTPTIETDEIVGSVDEVIIDQNGKSVGFENTVIRYVENKSLTVRSSNATTINTLVFNLEEKANNQTGLTYRFHVANVGLGKFYNPFAGGAGQQEIISTEIRKLKELVEAEFQNASVDEYDESIIKVDEVSPQNK